jgi:hypothetical protein
MECSHKEVFLLCRYNARLAIQLLGGLLLSERAKDLNSVTLGLHGSRQGKLGLQGGRLEVAHLKNDRSTDENTVARAGLLSRKIDHEVRLKALASPGVSGRFPPV